MYYKVLISVMASINLCATYKILLVFPFPFKSHAILSEAFVTILLSAGHEITYITIAPVADSHRNLRQIVIKPYEYKGTNIKELTGDRRSYQTIFDETLNVTYSAVLNENLQKLMEDTDTTFDLVIAEWMFNDLYSGFSAVFNCPYIWFFSAQIDQEILRLIHESPNLPVISNMKSSPVLSFNFLRRLQELIYNISSAVRKHLHYDPIETKAYEELFGPPVTKRGRDLPPFEVIRYNASLLFCNSHLSLRDSLVSPQSYKPIGGFHISGTPEPLNQELSRIIERSNGIILFSLGSFLKVEDIPSGVKRDLLEIFSKINHTILWKVNEQFEYLPSNVRTFAWLPIQSVLAHPKCVLFITHGGMLSLIESVHYGVPVIGVPVYGDQEINVKTAVKRGIGRMVPISFGLANDLMEAIKDMLSDPGYKENMRKLSSLYHDRPLSPRSELVHWVEHVAATHGAPHLRSTALLMPWYQKCYIDLAAMLLINLIGLLFAVIKLFVVIIDTAKHLIRFDRKYITEKKDN